MCVLYNLSFGEGGMFDRCSRRCSVCLPCILSAVVYVLGAILTTFERLHDIERLFEHQLNVVLSHICRWYRWCSATAVWLTCFIWHLDSCQSQPGYIGMTRWQSAILPAAGVLRPAAVAGHSRSLPCYEHRSAITASGRQGDSILFMKTYSFL